MYYYYIYVFLDSQNIVELVFFSCYMMNYNYIHFFWCLDVIDEEEFFILAGKAFVLFDVYTV